MVGIKPYKQTNRQRQPFYIGDEDKKLLTDRPTLSKIGGEDKMLQADKQTDATLRKLVVRIKHYKQTSAALRGPFGAKNVTSFRC